jgi:prepilin-type N-terminal cleavage/methylation domain-containing protein
MPRNASGFTLIEVLVATAIVVTVAAGCAQLLIAALRYDVASRQQLALMSAAMAKLDELAATIAGGTAPPGASGALDRSVDGSSDVITVSGVRMERRWLVAPLTTFAPGVAVVTVRAVPAAALAASTIELATIVEAGAS